MILKIKMNLNKSMNEFITRRIKLKRQTKLICTLDEKWNSYENISKLLKLGVDAIEIYSEIKEEIKKDIVQKVKTYAKENGQFISILYNLSYYRIYIEKINRSEEETVINQNQHLYITNEKYYDTLDAKIKTQIKEKKENLKEIKDQSLEDEYDELKFKKRENLNFFYHDKVEVDIKLEDQTSSHSSPDVYTIITSEPFLKFNNFSKTDILHFNYGEVSFRVEEIDENYLKCVALNSGMIQRNNSISVEGKEHFSNDLVNVDDNKLIKELNSAKDLDIDFIVMSVIENPIEEIKYIKEICDPINVIVKVDNTNSIQYIDEYIGHVAAIYISRSELNLKDNLSKICFYQKSIVSKCGYLGVPVIIAGTFLDTMRSLPNPIRAEISDLYNTILQGIDCLLLTSEIISGSYPFDVVETINEICSSCEKRVDYSNLFLEILYKTKKPMKIVEAVSSSTVKTSFNLQTPFIVCITETGTAARCVAKYRPYCPVLTLTSKVGIAQCLSIFRGIFCILYADTYNIDNSITYVNGYLIRSGLVSSKTNIVLLSGLNEKKNGTTDQMRVIELL